MGIFDKKSSSRTSQKLNDQTFNNVDGGASDINLNLGELNLSRGKKSGGNTNLDIVTNFTQTDHGAIDNAFEFAGGTLDVLGDLTRGSIDLLDDTIRISAQNTQQTTERALALAGEASRSEAATVLQQFVRTGAIVLVIGGVLAVIAKKIK